MLRPDFLLSHLQGVRPHVHFCWMNESASEWVQMASLTRGELWFLLTILGVIHFWVTTEFWQQKVIFLSLCLNCSPNDLMSYYFFPWQIGKLTLWAVKQLVQGQPPSKWKSGSGPRPFFTGTQQHFLLLTFYQSLYSVRVISWVLGLTNWVNQLTHNLKCPEDFHLVQTKQIWTF